MIIKKKSDYNEKCIFSMYFYVFSLLYIWQDLHNTTVINIQGQKDQVERNTIASNFVLLCFIVHDVGSTLKQY